MSAMATMAIRRECFDSRGGIFIASALPCRQYELQVPERHRALFGNGETRVDKELDQLARLEVSVPVQPSEKAGSSRRRIEVDGKRAPTRPNNSTHFTRELLSRASQQVMQHHRADHNVKSPVGKRQRLRWRGRERDVEPGLSRLAMGARD